MRYRLAPVKNVTRFFDGYGALANRDLGIPGIGLIYGNTGAGKSTALAYQVNQVNGVFVRATAVWTPSTMLGAICKELGNATHTQNARMLEVICEQLALSNRPLFVDEADYLLDNLKMLESLRDIHDTTSVPVILAGMAGIERRITRRAQFSRRISQWFEFEPLDLEDTRLLSDTVCEVPVAEGLLSRLHTAAKGNIGLMMVGLARIEDQGKRQHLDEIGDEDWGDRPFFLSRNQFLTSN